MASRGAKAKNGHFPDVEYETLEVLTHGEKVIKGTGTKHNMPDYSHSKNSVYVIKSEGEFRAMRIYGENHEPIVELARHPEARLNSGNREEKVWHMHIYKPGLDRQPAKPISQGIKTKYRELLEDVGYDQW